MNLQDTKELIAKLREQKLSRAYLQAIKPYRWRPKGFKLRTCFGLAEILNVIDRKVAGSDEMYTSVVFTIELSKIERWYEKAKFIKLASCPDCEPDHDYECGPCYTLRQGGET